ncbi:Diacetylchitobiose uptake system permease protein NgcG [subsurface metagenome]
MLIKRLRESGLFVIIQILCLSYSLFVLVPVLWSSISSFRSSIEFFTNPFGLPSVWKYQNFVYAWNQGNVGIYFRNSVFITAVCVTIIILLSAMASFALSRLKFRGRITVLFLFISGLFVPAALLLLPLFLMLQDLHVLGSYVGLIPVYVAYSFPFTVFVLVPFFNVIPQDLEEAAFLDGASYYQVFWKVMIPLAKPGLIVATIFNIFGIWNEFVLGYVLISKKSLKTLPLGLADILMKQHYTADYGKLFAAIFIALAPVAIFYVIFQRKLTGRLLEGAIKE